ncbi:Trafficking kinesin-binding protein 1 [Myotis davidii]|uniref:Trafficking kinesin-binding protein 1 n=1 Tax=Myotis davidii TaxID=225400 RepID=L5LFL3_MYODS|nr:Trafficking kinesin-binding protein 1 [Myotis davidii]
MNSAPSAQSTSVSEERWHSSCALMESHLVLFWWEGREHPNVCNSTDLPEVEIISLLEEQLPHYKLRADTIYGYDHDDWLHTPLLSPDANIDLTTEQIEETLKYFRHAPLTSGGHDTVL